MNENMLTCMYSYARDPRGPAQRHVSPSPDRYYALCPVLGILLAAVTDASTICSTGSTSEVISEQSRETQIDDEGCRLANTHHIEHVLEFSI